MAEFNGCDYCLSAHTYLGLKAAGFDEASIIEIVVNNVAQTDIDFPKVSALRAA